MGKKIFGIGLNKTGTTSLKLAFQKLGLKHLDRRPRLFKLYQKRAFVEIFEQIEEYESFEDWPWPLMVPELLDHYGDDALFVLTRRRSAEAWVNSLKKHSMRTHPVRNPREAIFGYRYPHGAEAQHMAFYDQHLENARALFKNRSHQLLEACWETGDGWVELCKFLDMRQPTKDFPHANKATESAPDHERVAENQRLINIQLSSLS